MDHEIIFIEDEEIRPVIYEFRDKDDSFTYFELENSKIKLLKSFINFDDAYEFVQNKMNNNYDFKPINQHRSLHIKAIYKSNASNI